MKTFFIFQILLVFSPIYAQSDSVKEAMKYYPLNNGNYWEFDVASGSDPYHYSLSPLYWLEVVGDSILPNSKNYKIIHKGSFYDKRIEVLLERIDTLDGSVFRCNFKSITEFKIDSLLSKPVDKIYASHFYDISKGAPADFRIFCLSEEQKTIFNHTWTIKIMNDNTRIPNELYKLAKGLGYIFSESWEGSYWSERLRYARIDGIEYGIKTDVTKFDEIPNQFILFQNYPNPFNPVTKINYSIPQTAHVRITIYNILGQVVKELVDEEKFPGNYIFNWDASKVASGIYICRIVASGSTQNFVKSIKMVYLK